MRTPAGPSTRCWRRIRTTWSRGVDDGSRRRRRREFLVQEDLREQLIRRADWAVGDETSTNGCRDITAEPCNGDVAVHPSPEVRMATFRRNPFFRKD